MKTNLSVRAFSLIMALTVTMSGPAMAAMFSDTSGNWAESAIDNLNRSGIMSGYSDGRFNPEGLITRAEFAATLVKANGWQNAYSGNGPQFSDVSPSFWGYRAIGTVAEKGVVSGYPGGFFRPQQNITRSEAMAMLINSAHMPLPNAQATNQILSRFSDAGSIPQWARPHVAAAIQSGIFMPHGNPNQIEPNALATRGDIAALTNSFMNVAHGGGGQNTPVANNPYNNAGSNWSPNPNQQYGEQQGNGSSWVRPDQNGNLQGYVSIVPAKTVFTASVTSPFSSNQSRVGDPVTVTIDKPITNSRGQVVIPEGSQLQGEISKIRTAGHAEQAGEVDVNFKQIVTPDGVTFPVTVEFNTDNGMLKAGTTKGRVVKTVGKAVVGGAVGTAAGAILGGIKGHGLADDYLARGAVIGGAVGTAAALAGKGDEVVVSPGESVELRFRQPLTVHQ